MASESGGKHQDIPKQCDELEERLVKLTSQALLLEERAEYAEKEALLRKRITDAKKRIKAIQPPGMLDSLSPNLGGLWGRIPTMVKILLVLAMLVAVLMFLGKACSG